MINILTRFHEGREYSIKQLCMTLQGQKYRHIISVENEKDECFIKHLIPDAVIVKVQKTGPYSFNAYINEMANLADGPVWVLDSDDLAEPNAIETIEQNYVPGKLNVFRIFYGVGCLPRMFHVPTQYEGMQISSQCLVWDPKSAKFPEWSGKHYDADNRFKNDCIHAGIEIASHMENDYIGTLVKNNVGKNPNYGTLHNNIVNKVLDKTEKYNKASSSNRYVSGRRWEM